nr:hypothetical protein [Trentepohlia sp. YN1317]
MECITKEFFSTGIIDVINFKELIELSLLSFEIDLFHKFTRLDPVVDSVSHPDSESDISHLQNLGERHVSTKKKNFSKKFLVNDLYFIKIDTLIYFCNDIKLLKSNALFFHINFRE